MKYINGIIIFVLFYFNLGLSFTVDRNFLESSRIHTDVLSVGFELQKYIEKITGIPVKVDRDTSGTQSGDIYIIKLDQPFCITSGCIGEQGFSISVSKGSIFITSPSEEGLLYGVYTLLEQLGVRFLSDKFDYIPEEISVDIENSKVYNPGFLYREVFISEADNEDYSLKNRLNGRLGHRAFYPLKSGDIPVYIVSLEDIFKNDEFSCGGQIDFTADEAVSETVRFLKDYIRKNNIKKALILISKNDNGNYCENPSSLNFIEKYGSPSAPYIDFVSKVAGTFRYEYPEIIFLAEAYLWSRKPPERFYRLPENMGIFFSTMDADLSKPLFSKENGEIAKDLLGWAKYTDNIYIWHYISNFSNYLIPFPDLYQISEDIRDFSNIRQIKGVFLEGAYNTKGSDMAYLKIFLFSHLLFEPHKDPEKLIDDFVLHYYGKESFKKVLAYIKGIHRYILDKRLSVKTSSYIYDTNTLKKYYLLLLEAEKESKGIYKKHIQELRFSLAVALLLNKNRLEDSNILKLAKGDVVQVIKDKGIERYSENGDIRSILNIDTEIEQIKEPEEVKGLIKNVDWFDYQEFSLKICCADIVKDPAASNGYAVSISGSIDDWAVQLNLGSIPKGRWEVYAVVKVISEYKSGLAFRYGVYPSDVEKEAYLQDFSDGSYHTVYIGIFEQGSEKDVWIAPPADDRIKAVLVDRIFIKRAD